jgi:multiple sugar transport system substrate-binding protein
MAVQQGAGMAVSKSTPQKERAAAAFLKWFTDTERNAVFCVESGYTPVKSAANDSELIMQALGTLKNTAPQLMQTLTVAVEQVETYTLYTNKPFPGGIEARALLETSMVAQAQRDRGQLDLARGQGADSEAVLLEARFSSTGHFDQWFDTFQSSLHTIVAEAALAAGDIREGS